MADPDVAALRGLPITEIILTTYMFREPRLTEACIGDLLMMPLTSLDLGGG